MRLGQLSRKINTSTSEIISFIENDFNETLEDHPNTKVPDIYITRIEQFFLLRKAEITNKIEDTNAELGEQEAQQPNDSKESEVLESPNKTITEEVVETEETETIEPDAIDNDDDDEANDLIIEDGVIKAPKPKVEGVKVVGKIDLPKPKEEDQNEEEVDQENQDASIEKKSTTKPILRDKNPKNRKRTRKGSRSKPVVSFEEQKKKEKEAYIKQQELKKQKEKELKRKNYESMMQEKKQSKKTVSKKNKKKNNKNINSAEQRKKAKQPTTIFGKFLRWLNT